MDLRQLEIVQAVAETGSFTGAGRKLHVSQSAISRQILLLEDELNESIFLRVGRRIRITPAGESLVQLSNRVFGDIKETITVIGESQQVLSGTLRLAGGMTVCMYVFPQLLQEYRRHHSGVEVKLITGTSQRLLQEIRTGAADLGFITLPVNESELVTVPAMEEEMLLVAHPSHPLAKKKRILPHDLVQQPFVLFEAVSNSRRVVDSFFIKEANRAAHRHGNRKRRDSQGAGAVGDGHHHHPLPGRCARGAEQAAVLRQNLRGASGQAHRVGVPEIEQGSADAGRDVQGISADSAQAEPESWRSKRESKY